MHAHLEVVDNYTYLGTVSNYNGSFFENINKQIPRVKKHIMLYCLRFVDLWLELFDQLVLPVLTYGCEVWGFNNISQINVIQRKFIKSILPLNSNTTNSLICGETCTLPISYHIKSRMINFVMRLLNGKQSKLSCVMYKLSIEKTRQNSTQSFRNMPPTPSLDIYSHTFSR